MAGRYENGLNNLPVTSVYGGRETGNSIGKERQIDNRSNYAIYLHWNNMQYSTGTSPTFSSPAYMGAGAIFKFSEVHCEESGEGWSDVEIGYGDTDFTTLFTIPAAAFNVSAPNVYDLSAIVAPAVALAQTQNYRLRVRHTSPTMPTAGRFSIAFYVDTEVNTAIGPSQQTPVLDGLS